MSDFKATLALQLQTSLASIEARLMRDYGFVPRLQKARERYDYLSMPPEGVLLFGQWVALRELFEEISAGIH